MSSIVTSMIVDAEDAEGCSGNIELEPLDMYQRSLSCSDQEEGQVEEWAHTQESFPPVPYHRRAKDQKISLSPRSINRKMMVHIKSYNAETGRLLSSDEAGKWGIDQRQFMDNANKVAYLIAQQQ